MPSSSRCLNATRASLGLWSKSAPRSESARRCPRTGASRVAKHGSQLFNAANLSAGEDFELRIPRDRPPALGLGDPGSSCPPSLEVLFAQDRFHAVEEVAPIAGEGVDAVGDSNEPPPENANRFLVGSTRF